MRKLDRRVIAAVERTHDFGAWESPQECRSVMRSVSGEFESGPWGEVLNWGRCVNVTSVDDIDAVRRLVTARGRDRRAVVFEWLTNTQRQALVDALQAAGFALRPFDETDRAMVSSRPTGIERLLMVPALPYVLVMRLLDVLVMRLRGRTTRMYEVSQRPEAAPPSVVSP